MKEDNKTINVDSETIKKISQSHIDYSGYDELNMSANIFADGSRIIPRIEIQHSKKYIMWGDNAMTNDYPSKLLELYNNSSLHHYIIDLKSRLTAGDGLKLKDPKGVNAQKTQEFIDSINSNGDSMSEINSKMALDLMLFAGHSTNITLMKDFSKIQEIKHLEFSKVRVAKPDDYGSIPGYFYSFNWNLYRPSKPVYCEKFNPSLATYNKKMNSEIMDRIQNNNPNPDDFTSLKNFITKDSYINFYKEYRPNTHYYPNPDYVAIIPSIEIDIQSDIYALASLMNGMDSGVRINIIGDPDDPDLNRSIKVMLKNYSGSRKAGKPWITVSQTAETAPQMSDIGTTNSLAQKYKVINDSQQQKILAGHGINNPAMVGIMTPGKLGSTGGQDIAQSYETFANYIIKPKQRILENFWNTITKYNGLDEVVIDNINIFNENTIETEQNKGLIDNANK